MTSREQVIEALTPPIDPALVPAKVGRDLSDLHWLRMCELHAAIVQQWLKPVISSSACTATGYGQMFKNMISLQKQYFVLPRKQQNTLEGMPVDCEVKLEDTGGFVSSADRVAMIADANL